MTTKTEKKSGFRSFLDGLNGLIKDAATAEGYKMGEEGELTIDESLPSKSGMESHTQLSGDTHIHIHAGPNESTTIAPTTDEGTEGTASEMEAEEDEDKKGFMDAMSAAYDAEMKKVKDRKASKDAKAKDKKAKDKKAKDAGEEEEDEEGNKETKDADTEEEGEAESEGSVETADADEEGEEKKDTKDKKSNDKKGTKDSAPLKDDFQALKSDVEILVPGLKMPTFDAAASHTATMDSMCLMRRRALAAHVRTEEGEETLKMLNGGKPLKLSGLTCDAASVFFNSAVQFAKDRNNEVGRLQRARTKDGASKPQTPADFNKATQAFYDAKKPKPKSA